VLFKKSYGSANLEWNVPNTSTTKFRLGSVTKQFTAAAILLLEERGKLKTDDPVKLHLPDAPAAWNKVTIFHLLTHTSGIPSLTEFPDFPTWKLSARTIQQSIDLFRDKPLEFPPGERYNYSNSGYLLLGYLVEKISGGTYETFVKKNIFDPLGMKDSGYDSNESVIPSRAAGYTPGPDGIVNADFVHMSIPHGAGALYSTTEDLLRWTTGLFGGKILSAASLEKMTTPFKEDYAFGLVVSRVNGRKTIRHGGGIEGFNTELTYYPDEKLTIVVLANLNGDTPERITQQLSAVAHGEKVVLPAEKTEVKLAPEQLTKYAGSYEVSPSQNMIITISDGRLSASDGTKPDPLFAMSATRFFFRDDEAEVEFEHDSAGTVTGLVIHTPDGKIPGKRIADRVEVALQPEILSRYPGIYELSPGFDLTITLEDGKLFSQATGQSKIPIYAEAEDKFFTRVMNAQLDFIKEKDGRVNGMVLHQGGRDMKAPRK
jgi:CubicO group peptidase (beta-lactamase class C family)